MPLVPKQHRSFSLVVQDPAFNRAADALALQGKNFINSAVYIARQVLFGLYADGKAKPTITDEQRRIVALANLEAQSLNTMRQERLDQRKFKEQKEQEKERKTTEALLALNTVEATSVIEPVEEPTQPAKKAKPVKPIPDGIKPFKMFLAESPDERAKSFQILDAILLIRLARNHVDEEGFCVGDTLPAAVANELVQRVIVAFQSILKARKAYYKKPRAFTGFPKYPGYLNKNDRATLFFPSSAGFGCVKGHLKEGQTLRFRPLKHQPSATLRGQPLGFQRPEDDVLGERQDAHLYCTIPTNFEKSAVLSYADQDAFAHYNLDQEWRAIKALNGLGDDAQLTEVRLVPQRNGKTKLEFCTSFDLVLPRNGFADWMFKRLTTVNPDMKEKDFNDELLTIIATLKSDELPVMAGSDPGVNNLISLAMTDGKDAIVVSGQRLENRLKVFDTKIDQRKGLLTPESVKVLQRKREAWLEQRKLEQGQQSERETLGKAKASSGEILPYDDGESDVCEEDERSAEHENEQESESKTPSSNQGLTPSELNTLKKGLKGIYQDATLIQLQEERENYINNFLHNLSAGLVEALSARGVELLVLGHNPMWKQESNMGRVQNRRLHGFAHHRLFQMLRYKALTRGILVVDVEESYTSKTSFVMNAPLRTFGDQQNSKKRKTNSTVSPAVPDTGLEHELDAQAATTGTLSPLRDVEFQDHDHNMYEGTRGTGKKRHRFTSPKAPPPWRVVHSDVNGGFNVLRKVSPVFRCTSALSLGFRIHWVSPKHGLVPMVLGRE